MDQQKKEQFNLANLIQIFLLLVTFGGGVVAFIAWRQEVTDRLGQIQAQQSQVTAAQTTSDDDRKALQTMVEHINTRLSRIEGKLNIPNGDGE